MDSEDSRLRTADGSFELNSAPVLVGLNPRETRVPRFLGAKDPQCAQSYGPAR